MPRDERTDNISRIPRGACHQGYRVTLLRRVTHSERAIDRGLPSLEAADAKRAARESSRLEAWRMKR